MTIDDILDTIRSLDGALILSPGEGSEFPPIAWGDHFFYHSPDGTVPQRVQPYGTIVTKNYPDDELFDLDREDRWRLNIHVGRGGLTDLVDPVPSSVEDPAGVPTDVFVPHPTYGGWVSVVNPAGRTQSIALDLLRAEHEAARRRWAEER